MKRFYFDYLDMHLDRRWNYTPSHSVYVPTLIGKAVVYDEANTPISTPNSDFNFGYIEVSDVTKEAVVQDILTRKWPALWMNEITLTQARAMLDANWYTHDGNYLYTIVPAWTNELTGEPTPAVTLNVV